VAARLRKTSQRLDPRSQQIVSAHKVGPRHTRLLRGFGRGSFLRVVCIGSIRSFENALIRYCQSRSYYQNLKFCTSNDQIPTGCVGAFTFPESTESLLLNTISRLKCMYELAAIMVCIFRNEACNISFLFLFYTPQ